ncbi:MAG: hypothetical protein FDW93_02720 [Bergeyella sp.]|nr:hypothetical protein [Bergeyella sp.]
MQNQNNKYQLLIEEACGTLGLSYQELKDKYKGHPVCLMEYVESNTCERVIEVRFDNQEATITITFDKENSCDASFLFYDNLIDEDSFIEHLNENTDYDFKRSSWIMEDCYLKVKPPTKYETAFCFYK